MPFNVASTSPPNVYQTDERRSQRPTVTAAAKEAAISPFVMGSDTCGFASSSTLTCDNGYDCVNVDNYRGCCKAGSEDCRSDVHMACLDYEAMPDASLCGPRLLCCPSSKAYCISYAFTTDNQPSMTFTHVRCAESPVLGELHPYPPALMTAIEEPNTAEMSSTVTAEPEDSSRNSSSPSSVSSGAIAGAVVGAVVFLVLLTLGIVFAITRHRKRRKERADNGAEPRVTPGPSDDDTGWQRPLSTVHEEPNSSPTLAESGTRRHSGSTSQRRSSGPSRTSSRRSSTSPLTSNPITDPERRPSSVRDLALRPSSSHLVQNDLPISQPQLQSPHWPRAALQPPPSQKRPESRRNSSGSSLSSIHGHALQSPRVTGIPPPAIDAAIDVAFNDDVGRRPSVGRPPSIAFNSIGAAFPPPPMHPARTPSLEEVLRAAEAGTRSRQSSHHGGYANTIPRNPAPSSDPRLASHHMSWLDDEDDVLGTRRLSAVSTASRRASRARGESLGDPVSPLSPVGSAEGRATPMTVSPLESRRGSYDEVRRD